MVLSASLPELKAGTFALLWGQFIWALQEEPKEHTHTLFAEKWVEAEGAGGFWVSDVK